MLLGTTLQKEVLFHPDRWPRRPYCTNDFKNGISLKILRYAFKMQYLQYNTPHLRSWIVLDCDFRGAAMAWVDVPLPPPTWTAMNPDNGHAHLVWGLSTPVLMEGHEVRNRPIRYLCAIESMMRDKLNADPGFAGLMTKNPLNPRWKVSFGPNFGYELGELAEWLPGLDRYIPKPRRPVEDVSLGRNVSLFDQLRIWAYSSVLEYKHKKDQPGWMSACKTQALVLNTQFEVPLSSSEVLQVAKSVAKWTWRHFSVDQLQELKSRTHSSENQAERGKQGGIASGISRRAKNADKMVEARCLAKQGLSTRTIARKLEVAHTTVAYWLRKK